MPEPETSLNESLDRLVSIIARRRWWILLGCSATTITTFFVLSQLPNRYSSEATLLVVQQQVPQRYVTPTTTTDIREALQATAQEVLARTRLTEIIGEFGLYQSERERLSPEGLLQLMRRDIKIQPLESDSERRDVNAFKISFIASNPKLAQEVTSKLTTLFIEQNLETREHQATTTTNFLQEQLEAAKNKLAEGEEVVRKFKMQYLGELPEQQPGNLAILGGLQAQLQNTLSSLSRAREQRQYLESLSEGRGLMIQGDLARLESERERLLRRYTPKYPAVPEIEVKIAQKEALLRTLRAARTPGSENAHAEEPSISIGTAEDPSIAQINGQLEANRLEIENLSRDEKQLKTAMARYQNRLNQTPVREQELAGMLRNYDLLKQDYADLLSKKMQSELAGNLEKRQEGQQFRLVDRPSLPTVPSSPDRVKIGLGGAAGGLGLGLLLAFLIDMRDSSFHSEEDLIQQFPVPLVLSLPLMLTASEERARTWKRMFEWLAGSGITVALFVFEFYELYIYGRG